MTSARRKRNDRRVGPERIGGEEIRDDDGLRVDEYTSDAYDDPEALDALDVPRALTDESVLTDVADPGSQLVEIDPDGSSSPTDDEAKMGLGAEPRSPEELADAAIGRELRGRRGVTRDGEVHGEGLLDRAPGEADK